MPPLFVRCGMRGDLPFTYCLSPYKPIARARTCRTRAHTLHAHAHILHARARNLAHAHDACTHAHTDGARARIGGSKGSDTAQAPPNPSPAAPCAAKDSTMACRSPLAARHRAGAAQAALMLH